MASADAPESSPTAPHSVVERPTSRVNDNERPKRASAACTRCRRYRQKCMMSWRNGHPVTPCEPCTKVGRRIAASCTVLPRGHSEADRSFRRRRKEGSTNADSPETVLDSTGLDFADSGVILGEQIVDDRRGISSSSSPYTSLYTPTSHISDLLPTRAELIEGVRVYLYNYMQLGFLPRAFFLEQVERDPSSVPVFLLLAILTISARFTPSLIKRFNGGKEASAEMRRRAMTLIGDEMMEASVERMQALFMLGVSELGEGNGGRSWLLTGIAIRMAATLRLHRESTYTLSSSCNPEEAIRSEVARRSFWLVYCHDQQIAGRSPSTTFPLSTIDVLLPCEEDDFIFGQFPPQRSALPGTLAAGGKVEYEMEPHRSLCATMIIGQWLWARTAEQASAPIDPRNVRPWEENGQFWKLERELQFWELNLPARHTFSAFTLRVMKGQHLDLAFLSISMLLRLSHIVLRRAYLPWMATAIEASTAHTLDPATPPDYWQGMALHMVQNCISLHQVTQTGLANRSLMDGFPAVFIFGVYICGDIAYYLNRWPKLCPKHAHHAPTMLQSSLDLLGELEEAWPLASRWKANLAQLLQTSNFDTTLGVAARESRERDEETGIYGEPSRSPTSFIRQRFTQPRSTATMLPAVAGTVEQMKDTHSTQVPHSVQPDAPNPEPSRIAAQAAAPQNPPTPFHFDLSAFSSMNETLFPEVRTSLADDMLPSIGHDAFGADLTAFLRGEPIDWTDPNDQFWVPGFSMHASSSAAVPDVDFTELFGSVASGDVP